VGGGSAASDGFLSVVSGEGVGFGVASGEDVGFAVDAGGCCAGTGEIGCVRIINIDVPNDSSTQFQASNRDFQRRFMVMSTYVMLLCLNVLGLTSICIVRSLYH
jgi:hypothetical protein